MNLEPIAAQTLRVFAAILRIRDRGELVTIRRLLSELGYASLNAVTEPLKNLTALGWIRRDRGLAGAIMPTRRMTVYLKPTKVTHAIL